MGKSIFALFAGVIAIGLFFFYTKPTYDSTDTIQADITQYNQALDKSTQLLQKKQQLMSHFNSFSQTDLDRLQKLMPDHVDNVALILDLDSLASHYGMGIENVDISTPASRSSNAAATAIASATAEKQDSLTLKFSTRGTYANFRQFLASLEQSLRIVDLTALTIALDSSGAIATIPGSSGITAAATNASEPTYRYDITLRTYWLK